MFAHHYHHKAVCHKVSLDETLSPRIIAAFDGSCLPTTTTTKLVHHMCLVKVSLDETLRSQKK